MYTRACVYDTFSDSFATFCRYLFVFYDGEDRNYNEPRACMVLLPVMAGTKRLRRLHVNNIKRLRSVHNIFCQNLQPSSPGMTTFHCTQVVGAVAKSDSIGRGTFFHFFSLSFRHHRNYILYVHKGNSCFVLPETRWCWSIPNT